MNKRGTYTWTITPNDIDREIKVWQDRKSGKLRNGWDFLAFNYDSEQIINVLKYAKELNKSVLITSSYLFWKADIIYDNYGNNNNNNSYNNKGIPNNDNNIAINEKVTKEEKTFAIMFTSLEKGIQHPITCKSSDSFSKVIQELYKEYPQLYQENIYFVCNANVIDTSATIEQNKIKAGSKILVCYD